MATEQQKKLMQEALDAQLTAEALSSLREQLDNDREAMGQFARLKMVDDLLKTAPIERAPKKLALNILARIAEMAEEMNAQPEDSPERIQMALALSLVVLVTLPLLVAAVTVYLSKAGNPDALNAVLAEIVNLLSVVLELLEELMTGAQALLNDYPEIAAVLVAIIPLLGYWLLRFMQEQHEKQNSDAE